MRPFEIDVAVHGIGERLEFGRAVALPASVPQGLQFGGPVLQVADPFLALLVLGQQFGNHRFEIRRARQHRRKQVGILLGMMEPVGKGGQVIQDGVDHGEGRHDRAPARLADRVLQAEQHRTDRAVFPFQDIEGGLRHGNAPGNAPVGRAPVRRAVRTHAPVSAFRRESLLKRARAALM